VSKPERTSSKPARIPAFILAALFIAGISYMCISGILKNPGAIVRSVKWNKAREFLADESDYDDPFKMAQARIASLQDRLQRNLPWKDELHELNASFQYALGRDMVVVGAEQMLRLPNGQLYYLTSRQGLADEAEELAQFMDSLPDDLPRFYAFVHPGFFEGGQQLPEGYALVDTSDELADQVLSIMRAHGIESLDSRTFFKDTGLGSDELELKTDKHWTTLAALLATRIYAEKLEEVTGADLPLERLDPDRFDTELHPGLFFGDFGELVGKRNAKNDDITVYLPKYDTHITRHSEHRTGDIEDEEGTFEQAVLRREKLTEELAYTDYGLIEMYEELTNPDAPDITVLVLRDSYAGPVCSFLSLVCGRVVSADLRYNPHTARELIEEVKPDALIVSYSRLMFEDHTYHLDR